MLSSRTIVHMTEIKASITDLIRPWEMRNYFRALGFKHVIIFSSTGEVGKGNYGSMRLSRFKLSKVRFGIGDTATDKDGRVIRCNLHELIPLTFVYMPCSSMKEELDERRINFNK